MRSTTAIAHEQKAWDELGALLGHEPEELSHMIPDGKGSMEIPFKYRLNNHKVFKDQMYYTGRPFYGDIRTNYLVTKPHTLTKSGNLTNKGLEWIESNHKNHTGAAKKLAEAKGIDPNTAPGRIVVPLYNGKKDVIPVDALGEFDLYRPVKVGNINMPFYKKYSYGTKQNNFTPLKDWTPEQWTAAQDKAIAEGDMVRAQMLRDLHFKIHANPVLTQEGNMKLTHATKNKFNIFDLDKAGSGSGNVSNTEGVIHLSPYDESALDVFKTKSLEERNKYNLMHLYAHNPNPVNVDLKDFIKTFNDKNAFKKLRDAGDGIIARGQSPYKIYNDKVAEYEAKKAAGKLNMWDSKPESPTDFMEESVVDGYTINKPEYVKSADAVTYNGYGVRIPLGKRDNFKNMDIRYGFIPLTIGGKYLYNNVNNK